MSEETSVNSEMIEKIRSSLEKITQVDLRDYEGQLQGKIPPEWITSLCDDVEMLLKSKNLMTYMYHVSRICDLENLLRRCSDMLSILDLSEDINDLQGDIEKALS